jgi:cation diffusion facilitator CzcD-associated flavoprotein CzcO
MSKFQSVDERLLALAVQARAELDMLSFATKPWVKPRHRDGTPLYDVAIIGGGQSGLIVSHALMRAGVGNILMLDRAPAGQEGVWESFARMHEIRSPKEVTGTELGVPSLSIQSWYHVRHGREAWDAIKRVPRLDWAAYLRWYHSVVNPPAWNDANVTDINFDAESVVLNVSREGRTTRLSARFAVLATGMDGGGEWQVPDIVARALPRERYNHTSDIFDVAALKGRRLGILGAGAAAFDIAVASLKHQAAAVEMFLRRPTLPLIDVARELETVGQLQHYAEMADTTKWALADFMTGLSQSPAEHHFYAACAHPAFVLRACAPWIDVGLQDGDIIVKTPKGSHHFDHVAAATGAVVDMNARRELERIAEVAALWRHRFTPPAHENASPRLNYPYLGGTYQFIERVPGSAPGLDRILAFNALSSLSLGAMSSLSISGHKYGVPRLVRGITARLWAEQEQSFVDELRAYRTPGVVVPPRIRAMLNLAEEDEARQPAA